MQAPDWAQSIQRYHGRLTAGRPVNPAAVPLQPLSQTQPQTQMAAEDGEAGAPVDLHALAVRMYLLWNYE